MSEQLRGTMINDDDSREKQTTTAMDRWNWLIVDGLGHQTPDDGFRGGRRMKDDEDGRGFGTSNRRQGTRVKSRMNDNRK